jgi:flagellar basal-body rod protein FlgC
MFDSVSASAASGLAAALRRAEASSSNLANADSRGALPVGEAANVNAPSDTREAYVPVRVEQSSTAEGSTATRERAVIPAYVLIYEPSSNLAGKDGFVAEPNVDPAAELGELTDAETSLKANAAVGQSVQDMVRELYDLPQ